MADFVKFRTAINGFNRSDVSNFIETSAQEHETALEQAQQQLTETTKQLNEAVQKLDASNHQLAEAQKTENALRRELDEAKKALDESKKALDEQTTMSNELLQQLDETETALKATQSALEEAMEPETVSEPDETTEEPQPDYPAMELEAYRRAEAMERLSAERSAKLRSELNDLLDQVSSRYEQTGTEIQALTEDIRTNLQRLMESMSDLDVIFDETSAKFDTMDADTLDEEA